MTVADLLVEATYETIRFPVSDFNTEGGNDLAEHVSYRRAGADLEPTGAKAVRGSLSVVLTDIPALVQRYGAPLTLLRNLLDKFRDVPIGQLAHPLEGNLTVGIGAVHRSMSSDKRSVVGLTFEWVAQGASGQQVLELRDDPSLTSPQTAATNADTAAASARTAGYSPVAPTVKAQLDALGPSPSYGEVQSAFAAIGRLVRSNLALPALQTSASAPVASALGALQASLLRARNSILPDVSSAPTFTVPAGGMPLWQIAATVYGDPSASSLLLNSNPISTPRSIPAGTVILLPPRT